MKDTIHGLLLSLFILSPALHAESNQPLVYLNKHFGFNVPGYKYAQAELPCDIDSSLVELLVANSAKSKITLQPVGTADKIRNGIVPVLAIDIEQLVLSKDYQFGTETRHPLPKVQVTAAVIKGDNIVTAKHTCVIATLNEFTPASNVLDLGTATTTCGATRKCLGDLSKDIVEWLAPQVQNRNP